MLEHMRNFLEDINVASVAPTRMGCVTRICGGIDFNSARVIVEYGPGDGAFTKYLLDRIHPHSRLIAIETNERFVQRLRSEIRDKRLHLIHNSAAKVRSILADLGVVSADCVLSGIPFSFLSLPAKSRLIRDTALALRPGGRFLVYQALPAIRGKASLTRALRPFFRTNSSYYLFLNLPPLYVIDSIPRRQLTIH